MKQKPKQQLSGEISPEKYRENLSKIEILEICISSFSSFILRDQLIPQNNPVINILDEYEIYSGSESSKATAKMNISIQSKEQTVFNIEVIYNVYLANKEELSPRFWDVYKSATLPLKIWPYFREFVQNTTSRMNIPPLTLPFRF